MSNRRVFLGVLAAGSDHFITSEASGVAGETFETEVYFPYGFWTNPDAIAEPGQTPLLEINNDPDDHIALPPSGDYIGPDGTMGFYYGDNRVTLSNGGITIEAGGKSFRIENGEIVTDMDIRTTGSIAATDVILTGGVPINLRTHIHTTPSGPSGPPQ